MKTLKYLDSLLTSNLFICYFAISPLLLSAQVPSTYQIGSWYHFKAAAVTYSFDDNTSNQVPVAIPIFDKYNFKATLNIITHSGSMDWESYNVVAKHGHEIASHSVTHRSLGSLSFDEQDIECKNSQENIHNYVPKTKCRTFAYPYCNKGDISILKKYYIAARGCSGQIVSSTPQDFYDISSIGCGSLGINTAEKMNIKVNTAKYQDGWCVFLIHGIDNDGGYSPLESTTLASHLEYVNKNSRDYWVATFLNVVKYIRERNSISIKEDFINNDSLTLVPSDSLDNKVYDVAITIRRQLPSGWDNAVVYQGQGIIPSCIVNIDSSKYLQFDVIPDFGTYSIAKRPSRNDEEKNNTDEWLLSPPTQPSANYTLSKKRGKGRLTIINSDGIVVFEDKISDHISIGNKLPEGDYRLIIRDKKSQSTKNICILK